MAQVHVRKERHTHAPTHPLIFPLGKSEGEIGKKKSLYLLTLRTDV